MYSHLLRLPLQSFVFSILTALLLVLPAVSGYSQTLDEPVVGAGVLFEEVDGVVAAEAEHFYEQTKTEVRRWYRTSADESIGLKPDIDPVHAQGASGGVYLEILPDTRWTHGEQLIVGENFMPEAGKMAILSYKVFVHTPGRYYVWARIFSTGTEDNGMHVGINGTWPASGQRMQWTTKRRWVWGSKQRTKEVHSGVPHLLYLDIDQPGEHVIQFAMREDGTEFDKWMMTREKLDAVQGLGPKPKLKSGELPKATLAPVPALERLDNGDATVRIAGELKCWHKVTLTLDGPFAHEMDTKPNPFRNYRFDVEFTHESGDPSYRVPGYFAADGKAAESSADSGTAWRAHLSPDRAGKWTYTTSFVETSEVDGEILRRLDAYDGLAGSFQVAETDKQGRDFRSAGRLTYVGKHHLQHAGSGEFFLKAGPDSPETLLAYEDFDGTTNQSKPGLPLKSWRPHVQDWKDGDPTWQGGKGKGLVGAINYLVEKGVNAMSFMPYNAGGDGDNIWPFVSRDAKFHYDASKLDQWQIVFDHAQANGIFLHFKTQETEMDDNRDWNHNIVDVPTSLDNGKLGPERRLYYRELIARFGYLLALNWNLGEETTQSAEEHRAMAEYFREHDPYQHLVVIHTKGSPQEHAAVYEPLLGNQSDLTGASLQNWWGSTHALTLRWVIASAAEGKPWVVANDEQGGADVGVPPDLGYEGYAGGMRDNGKPYTTTADIRKATLWGNLMAGGAGVEYYFGYKVPQGDLRCEDWRSRDSSWEYAAIALSFFSDQEIPFWDMVNRNALVGNEKNANTKYCLAKRGEVYLVYLSHGGEAELDLKQESDDSIWDVRWFDPRVGGALQSGEVDTIQGGKVSSLGLAKNAQAGEDWLAIVRKR